MRNKKYRKYKKQNIFQQNFSFAGEIGAAEFWSEVGVRFISFLCASVALCIVVAVAVPGSTEELSETANVAVPILAVVWFFPIIALTRRRLRDAGCSAKTYLWLLLPVIGWIVFLVRLCSKSK